MNTKLQDAVAIFKELNWENVTTENILNLSTGSAEQKRTAIAGLKSGAWGEFAAEGWRSFIDVDEGNLALFAVRVGVDARRAANITYNASQEMLIQVIAERGTKYASDFIRYACVSQRRGYEHSASGFGNAAVRLVVQLNLDIPQNVEYMKDWSVYAAAAMGLQAEIRFNETNLPSIDLIKRRFTEHVLTGVAVNTPATGPFGAVLPEGVKRGWLSREIAVDLIFSALDASVRPGDRKVWLDVLEELEVSDTELCARTQSLIPLLALGETAVITSLAPRLIAQADNDSLTEVILAAFSAQTKKARKLVLKSALSRSCPENTKDLEPWLSDFINDTDKNIVTLASRLIKQWGITVEQSLDETDETHGYWQETPEVWQIPSFELGLVSPEALTELAAKMVSRPAMIHDVIAEQFLAMANAAAYQNPEAARTSLRGLRHNEQLIDFIVCWVRGENPRYGGDDKEGDIKSILDARDYVVCLKLGELPCLLSTPSVVDLSISVPDLAARLELYKKTNTDALEADLFLALTRLDERSKTPETICALNKLDVPIRLQSGVKMSVTAGPAVLAYLDNPIREPALTINKDKYWVRANINMSEPLHCFPNRVIRRYWEEYFSIFPHWGDAALTEIKWDCEVCREQGLILRQAARRGTPLPPGAAINLLAAQRSMTPDAAEDSLRAVTEAWERGLLRPGIPKIDMLDWSAAPPANLSALASVLDDFARDGMLGVVWPILDGVIEASLEAPRLRTGIAEFANLIEVFLPEVKLAVERGITDDRALFLPGIRSLAQYGGSSRAVGIAKKVVSLLPPAPVTTQNVNQSLSIMDPPFHEVWPKQKGPSLSIEDGVTITVDWANPKSPTRLFLFTLTLPDVSDRVFQIVNKGWHYDLSNEGQCIAYAVAPDTSGFIGDEDNQVWLHWDAGQRAMVVCDKRNWIEGKDNPLRGTQVPPLSASLVIVIIGLLAQDGDAKYYAPALLRECIKKGRINEQIIRKATQIFLQNPVVSPAKLVRILEKDISLLYILWPMLTECIKYAGNLVSAGEAPPVWVNRVLDIVLRYQPYLTEAANRGFISPEDAKWKGLSEIASSKSKSAAVAKAKKLQKDLF